jgi:hypothetical protein
MRRAKIVLVQALEGKELEAFDDNIKRINALTNGLMCSVSVSGFNTRFYPEKTRKEVYRELKRQRKLFKTSSTNGSSNVWPSLVIIQNYGFSVYGVEQQREEKQC